jgi:hypothetical protein
VSPTPEQFKQAVEVAKRSTKLAQDLKAANDQFKAERPSADEIAQAVDHMITCRVLDPAHKEAGIAALADPKRALETIVNLADLVAQKAADDAADPGSPVKRAGDGGPAAGPSGPPKLHDYTDDPEYAEITSGVMKLAAAAASV